MQADPSSQHVSLRAQDLLKPGVLGIGAALLTLLPAWAGALSLGTPQLDSRLGQALDLSIPIRTEPNEDFDSRCIRLVNPVDDQLPTLTVGRVRIDRDGVLLWARIQSLGPINEPALRLVVELGCTQRVQREYVLLIDPPLPGRAETTSQRMQSPAPLDTDRPLPAITFGEPRIQAVQGRRLVLAAPVLGADAAGLTSACLRLVDDGGQPPVYADARLRLTGAGGPKPMLDITSSAAVSDRMLRIVVEAGCGPTVRREFNILVEAAPIPSSPSANDSQAQANLQARASTAARQSAAPRPAASSAAPRTSPAPRVATPSPGTGPADGAVAATPQQPSPAGPDRLVLASPDEPRQAIDARPITIPDPSVELVKRLDELSTEVKRLRGELDAANKRNAAMAGQLAQERGWTLGWWIAGVIALAFAAWLAIAWRRRGRETEEENPSEGPLTRIIGKPTVETPAAQPAPAGTAMGSVLMGSHLSEMRPELHVTEMADEEAIRELYADVIRGNTKPMAARPTNVDIPLDLLAGDTAISGSVENDRDARKDGVTRVDARAMGNDGARARLPGAASEDDASVEPWVDGTLPPSQLPTTVLKPLELDLDLSNFTQRNDKRPGN
jgi:hypothetical protein